jgi:atypical dual specificity phosphatase
MMSFPTPKWQTAVLALANKNGTGTKAPCASLIMPRLYLSDLFTAKDKEELTKLGITHVISVLEHEPVIPPLIAKENRLFISVADRADVDLLQHLEQTTTFIQTALDADPENKVLVCRGRLICSIILH